MSAYRFMRGLSVYTRLLLVYARLLHKIVCASVAHLKAAMG